jgi:hypothetical protein
MACVTKTRSPQAMGEELQGPGSWTRHRTFSVAPHLTGRFFSEDTPVPSGPRQPGQFPDGAENAVAATSNTVRQHTTGLFFLMMVSPEVSVAWQSKAITRDFPY